MASSHVNGPRQTSASAIQIELLIAGVTQVIGPGEQPLFCYDLEIYFNHFELFGSENKTVKPWSCSVLRNPFVVILWIILSSFTVKTATAKQQETMLSSQQQVEILTEFSVLLARHYVVTEKSATYIAALRNSRKKGLFSNQKSATAFAEQTNEILQDAHPDKHLGLLLPQKFKEVMQMFHPEALKDEQLKSDDDVSDHENSGPGKSGHKQSSQADQTNSSNTHTSSDHKPVHHFTSGHQNKNAENTAENSLAKVGVGRVSAVSRDGLNEIGFIELTRFDSSMRSQQFIDRVMSTFSDSDGIIIDLRICQGGDAEMVKVLSSYFFDKPTHLLSSTMPADAKGNRLTQKRWTQANQLSEKLAKMPLKILISPRSFSAAESFAFGMQALGRAELIGETTGGGGYMNDFYPLPSSFGASISVGRTFDPRTGKDWQGIGVKPDLEIDSEIALATALHEYTIESGKLLALAEDDNVFAIYEVIQAYTNAWYGADADTMQQVLSNNFLAVYRQANDNEVSRFIKSQWVKQTAEGKGTRENKIHYNRIIKDIKIEGRTATATLRLRETIHKMKLHISADRWVINHDSYEDKTRG
jgi:hypothetical protein